MSQRGTRILILAASVVGAAVGGYYFGFAGGRSALRSIEAAEDLLVPVDDTRRTRLRREGIRAMLARVAELQAQTYATSNSYLPVENIPFNRDVYHIEAFATTSCRGQGDSCTPSIGWVAVGRHVTSPDEEVCAIALNTEPVYAGGVPLKRAGKIRCRWDLATRINRLLM